MSRASTTSPMSPLSTGKTDRGRISAHEHATKNAKLALRVDLDREKPEVDSVTSIWKGANYQEREVFDLMGVVFNGPSRSAPNFAARGLGGLPAKERLCHPGLEPSLLRSIWARSTRARTGCCAWRSMLDGEVVVECQPDVGYLHRGIEKLAEMRTYIQFIPITDRLDYLASMLGNAAYVGAVEKLGADRGAGARGVYPRHNDGAAAHREPPGLLRHDGARPGRDNAVSLLHSASARIYSTSSRWSAARGSPTTTSAPAGSRATCPPASMRRPRPTSRSSARSCRNTTTCFTNNQIFIARTRNVGIISAEDAINYSLCGPSLRGSGVAYDVRKADPYSVYDKLDWQVVTYPDRRLLCRGSWCAAWRSARA